MIYLAASNITLYILKRKEKKKFMISTGSIGTVSYTHLDQIGHFFGMTVHTTESDDNAFFGFIFIPFRCV